MISNQKIFPETVEEILKRRPQQIERWIIDANRIIQLAFEESETIAKNPITDYFHPMNNLPPAATDDGIG